MAAGKWVWSEEMFLELAELLQRLRGGPANDDAAQEIFSAVMQNPSAYDPSAVLKEGYIRAALANNAASESRKQRRLGAQATDWQLGDGGASRTETSDLGTAEIERARRLLDGVAARVRGARREHNRPAWDHGYDQLLRFALADDHALPDRILAEELQAREDAHVAAHGAAEDAWSIARRTRESLGLDSFEATLTAMKELKISAESSPAAAERWNALGKAWDGIRQEARDAINQRNTRARRELLRAADEMHRNEELDEIEHRLVKLFLERGLFKRRRRAR